PAGDAEEGVDCARLELVAGVVRLELFDRDVLFTDAVGGEDEQRVDPRARAAFVERHALALEIGDRSDARTAPHDQVDGLLVEVGDGPQGLYAGLAVVQAATGRRPVGDVGLDEARVDRALRDVGDIGDRAFGRDGGGDEAGHPARAAAGAGGRAGRTGDRPR